LQRAHKHTAITVPFQFSLLHAEYCFYQSDCKLSAVICEVSY